MWLGWAVVGGVLLLAALALLVPKESRQAEQVRETSARDAEQKRQNAEYAEFKKKFDAHKEPPQTGRQQLDRYCSEAKRLYSNKPIGELSLRELDQIRICRAVGLY